MSEPWLVALVFIALMACAVGLAAALAWVFLRHD